MLLTCFINDISGEQYILSFWFPQTKRKRSSRQ